MAYPMMQWPTFGEFRARLKTDFQVEYKKLPQAVCIDDGEPETVLYFERVLESGEARRVSVAITSPFFVSFQPITILMVQSLVFLPDKTNIVTARDGTIHKELRWFL